MDKRRFPLLARYVDGLPDGLASHPSAEVKGSVYRTVISTAPVKLGPEGLPPELARVIADPPLPSAWTSEVQLNALGLAYQEVTPRATYEKWVYERNRSILTNPIYKILFWMIGPERLFVGLPHRWSAFRRGTELSLIEKADHVARLRLTYPLNLHDEITLFNVTMALRAVAEAAGAASASARVERCGPTSAVLEIAWT